MILIVAAYLAAITGIILNLCGFPEWGSFATYSALTFAVFGWVGRYIEHRDELEQP